MALRQILRRLVPNRRRESHLASWDHENLLFVCATSDYKSFTFAHFKGAKSANAKLSTFGWQVGDRKLRTLCEFNLPALVWPEDDGADAGAWIANWTKAFDKEPLTRDFFKRFDKALEKIKADLEEVDKLPSAAAHTKSQLLLERLIFLYYLQNRGWLNQQRNYLLDNFAPHRERPKEYSYYSDFLEKLFWTLASPSGSAARIYGIPFLNGGLFDDDEFAQNPMRRKHNPPLSIRNSTFSFVFDEFLEAFNFTVREDTPLNQDFQQKLRRLGGADFDSPLNLAWSIDFSSVFASDSADQTAALKRKTTSGFDIVVGNPPFVTARNSIKRELYRERWPSVCYKEFQLVCPFFALSFSLLRPDGHIGFIVSNAFAMREFGRPLLEDFFSRVDLRKIVNCDGLSFPGHGTPTCIVLGRLPVGSNDETWKNIPIRVATRLPGGGDLRAIPEESPLWQALSTYHDTPGYSDGRIVVADRQRSEFLRWPLNFDSSAEATKQAIEQHSAYTLKGSVQDIGYSVLTKSDDIFFVPPHVARAQAIEHELLRPINIGDELRNWTFFDSLIAIAPYDARFRCVEIEAYPNCQRYLTPFRSTLESVITFGKTKKQAGRKWFEYFDPYSHRHAIDIFEAYADIATHNHFVVFFGNRLLKDTAPLVILQASDDAPVVAGLLNSSQARLTGSNKNFVKKPPPTMKFLGA